VSISFLNLDLDAFLNDVAYAAVRAQIVTIEKRIHAWLKKADGWRKSLMVLARLSPPRWWLRWEIGKSSRRALVNQAPSTHDP
jgi:hypothetical protein